MIAELHRSEFGLLVYFIPRFFLSFFFFFYEKIIFEKLCSKYEIIQLMGYFRSPLIVLLNMVKSMIAVLVRRFYDVCRYKASLGTAKQSSRINGTAKLPGVCPHEV